VSSALLVLIPRVAAAVAAVYLLRAVPRLLRGERMWVAGRADVPHLIEGWTARVTGVLVLALGLAFALFAAMWRGPSPDG
jgi:hypothetical protein